MKTILTAVFCVVSVAGVGVLIPHLLYKDASNVTTKEAEELKKQVILEDPRNVMQITKLVVRERKDDVAVVDMYTFFGFKYDELKIELNPRTKRPYR